MPCLSLKTSILLVLLSPLGMAATKHMGGLLLSKHNTDMWNFTNKFWLQESSNAAVKFHKRSGKEAGIADGTSSVLEASFNATPDGSGWASYTGSHASRRCTAVYIALQTCSSRRPRTYTSMAAGPALPQQQEQERCYLHSGCQE